MLTKAASICTLKRPIRWQKGSGGPARKLVFPRQKEKDRQRNIAWSFPPFRRIDISPNNVVAPVRLIETPFSSSSSFSSSSIREEKSERSRGRLGDDVVVVATSAQCVAALRVPHRVVGLPDGRPVSRLFSAFALFLASLSFRSTSLSLCYSRDYTLVHVTTTNLAIFRAMRIVVCTSSSVWSFVIADDQQRTHRALSWKLLALTSESVNFPLDHDLPRIAELNVHHRCRSTLRSSPTILFINFRSWEGSCY